MEKIRVKHSVVFIPPLPELTLVKEMKCKLHSKIGRYVSCNSQAHITICEFEASEKELIPIKAKLSVLCDSEIPIEVHFNHINNYGSKTIFIAPSVESKPQLKRLMTGIQENLHALHRVRWGKSTDPHMSIARGLDQEKSAIANSLFKTIDMTFCCDRIALRRLDHQIKQFVVIDEYLFKSMPVPSEGQLALF
ncbi:MAG: 2-5 ligase [Daejeonella sp.]|nr:2-5 ligase [Daejeonella sp.]